MWKLIGIDIRPAQCDHCGRNLARVFKVEDPNGQPMVVGVACCKKLTGYNWSVKQAQIAQWNADRDAVAVAAYGAEAFAAVEAGARDESSRPPYVAGRIGEVFHAMRGMETYLSDAEVDAGVAECVGRWG